MARGSLSFGGVVAIPDIWSELPEAWRPAQVRRLPGQQGPTLTFDDTCEGKNDPVTELRKTMAQVSRGPTGRFSLTGPRSRPATNDCYRGRISFTIPAISWAPTTTGSSSFGRPAVPTVPHCSAALTTESAALLTFRRAAPTSL